MMASSSSRINRLLSELPVGFRFYPTEEELVRVYLMKKLQGNDFLVSQVIPEIDILDYEPWILPAYSLIESDDQDWFFFSRPDFKHNTRNRNKRSTKEGYWKITGRDREIKARDNRTVIGKKRTMTFYKGRHHQDPQITNWVIHEYYIPDTHPNAKQRDFVLCHLKKKSDGNTDVATCDEGEPSIYNASDFESQPQGVHHMDIQEECTHPQENLDYFEMARNLLLADAHSNNDNHGLQSAFVANEPDDDCTEFVDSLFNDHDQDLYEEATHTTMRNDSTLRQSSKRVYVEDGKFSSDTDTEAVHEVVSLQSGREVLQCSSHSRQDKDILLRYQLQAASFANVAPNPQTNSLQLVTKEHPSTYERRTRIPEPKPIYASKDASSVSADKLGINSLQLVTDDYYKNERTRRRSYPQGAPTALGKLREQQSKVPAPMMLQNKANFAAERQGAVSLPLKMTSTTKSSIDKKVAQGNNAEKGMKQTQNTTTTSSRKGSFISWQTSPLTSPPSVYICDTVLGTILFMIFARELVLYGQWC